MNDAVRSTLSAIAPSYGADHLRMTRALIRRDVRGQGTMSLRDEHPMIRPLSDYRRFVRDTFSSEEVLS